MASVYRRGNSPYYYCRYAVGGRYVRRSTQEKTEAAAQRIANRWEAEAWSKQSPTRIESIQEEFLAWAAERGIPEGPALGWLDARVPAEILSSLKRLEAKITELQRLLIAQQ